MTLTIVVLDCGTRVFTTDPPAEVLAALDRAEARGFRHVVLAYGHRVRRDAVVAIRRGHERLKLSDLRPVPLVAQGEDAPLGPAMGTTSQRARRGAPAVHSTGGGRPRTYEMALKPSPRRLDPVGEDATAPAATALGGGCARTTDHPTGRGRPMDALGGRPPGGASRIMYGFRNGGSGGH